MATMALRFAAFFARFFCSFFIERINFPIAAIHNIFLTEVKGLEQDVALASLYIH